MGRTYRILLIGTEYKRMVIHVNPCFPADYQLIVAVIASAGIKSPEDFLWWKTNVFSATYCTEKKYI